MLVENSDAHIDREPPDRFVRNGVAVALATVPLVSSEAFTDRCVGALRAGARLVSFSAAPRPPLSVVPAGGNGERDDARELVAILAHDARGTLEIARTRVHRGRFPSLTAAMPQAQAFEREIWEMSGLVPDGHPWLKPLRRHPELAKDGERIGKSSAPHPFFRVEGAGIHEVAVGPVHAGVIEPGHFRFQCHGETVLSLEIHLGYQHRGAEALLVRSSPARRLAIAESIAGDTAVGHALAHCMAIEALSAAVVPDAADTLRAIALELERLANHVGDLGALCNDVGYLPGASWFGRLRGEFLNLLMELSGNRFGRGLVRPGGVRFGLSSAQRADFAKRLAAAERDLEQTAELTFGTPSVLARFERTGIVSKETADALGLVGPVGRASGCDRDVRRDHPFGIYGTLPVRVATVRTGDVMARAVVRHEEAKHALAFLRQALERLGELPDAPLMGDVPGAAPNNIAIALTEGWRGEIAHVATTDDAGRLASYAIVDPSFHNWFGLAMALRNNEISDFPLCNKSFNLSYAGHDL